MNKNQEYTKRIFTKLKLTKEGTAKFNDIFEYGIYPVHIDEATPKVHALEHGGVDINEDKNGTIREELKQFVKNAIKNYNAKYVHFIPVSAMARLVEENKMQENTMYIINHHSQA
ncbi:hypothetical protein [Bartonella sp. A05]|uniref:hypothetical protein n=1 Tax=Bartonella sp. A05 TaxID=2967261 RepID=UPI0022A9B970|nr:hypothetical protein [Bartonella sp. A05]MCZ2204417.1 hypothetical protein [Bartonella sp. A05]